MHHSTLEAAITLLTNASREELESHSHSIKSLLDKLRALTCVIPPQEPNFVRTVLYFTNVTSPFDSEYL